MREATIIIGLIQDEMKHLEAHPLFRNIWRFVQGNFVAVFVCYIFRKANSIVDWIASFIAEHIEVWTWHQDKIWSWGL